MNRPSLPTGLSLCPVIGILRGCPFRNVGEVVGAAVAGGLRVIEVTLDSEKPLEQIAAVRQSFPGIDVGAGTVRRADEVAAAVDAGAGFVVSPIVDAEMIETAIGSGVACLPGAATPSEIELSMRLGATAVKVFPIEQLGGIGYLGAILSPLGHPPLVPTGGVSVGSIQPYLQAGAVAVGVGGALFPKSALDAGDGAAVEGLAREVTQALP